MITMQPESISFLDKQPDSNSRTQKEQITTEIQAALTVIGRCDSSKEKKGQCIELPSTNLIKANLTQANLAQAILTQTNLNQADLSRANLCAANLAQANLTQATLSGAYLWRAYLWRANLRKANLWGADLSGAYLIGVITLNSKQISTAIINEETKLPEYLQSFKPSQPEPPEAQKP